MQNKLGLMKIILPAWLIFCLSCIDKSVENINNSVFFNPTYSLPIGPVQFTAKDIINSSGFKLIDTSKVSDTTGYFWYDSAFYNDNYGYFDTVILIDFTFSSISDKLDETKSLMIRLNITNGFPTNLFTQMYFGDANNLVIDSLFTNGFLKIPSADVNDNGEVANPFLLRNFDTYLSQGKIQTLKKVQYVHLFIRVVTKKRNGSYVKLYPTYTIRTDIAIRIELYMNLGDI